MIRTFLRIQFLRLWNNWQELLLVFVMPVLFFTIFAAIFSNGIATGSSQELRIGWVSPVSSVFSQELKRFLEQNQTLRCEQIDRDHLDGVESSSIAGGPSADTAIREIQRSGRYDLLIRVDGGSQENAGQIIPPAVTLVTDGQNPMAVSMVGSMIEAFHARYVSIAVAQRFAHSQAASRSSSAPAAAPTPRPESPEARHEPSAPTFGGGRMTDPDEVFDSPDEWIRLDGSLQVPTRGDTPDQDPRPQAASDGMPAHASNREITPPPPPIPDPAPLVVRTESPQEQSKENPRIAMYAAGIAVLFLLFSSTGNAAALLEEEESGTLDRILVSQAGLVRVMLGKWLGIVLLGILQITVMFGWAEAVFQIGLREHFAGFLVMTISTSAATASFAMLLATLCRSRTQLNAISVVTILSMSAVGGSMIPRFIMSDRMKQFGCWTFNAWALDGYQKVFWYELPVSSLRTEAAVLAGSALVLGLFAIVLSGRWKRG